MTTAETATDLIIEPETETVQMSERPEWLPEKFWNTETAEPRLESLVKSYRKLEQRFGEDGDESNPEDDINLLDVPETAEGYEVNIGDKVERVAPEIATRLLSAGFTRPQAQLAYDLAVEQLSPIAEEVAEEIENRATVQREQSRLVEHFGGTANWGEVSRQMEAWGKANLSDDVFDAMVASFEGVIAMHRMMDVGEPEMLVANGAASHGASISDIKRRMRDPKYWRERDPKAVAEVRQGFKALFPEG